MIAHELSHVYNRDILISSVAATIGARHHLAGPPGLVHPDGGDDDDGRNPIAALLMLILGSAGRDDHPDGGLAQPRVPGRRDGRRAHRDPHALASALRKIEGARAAPRRPRPTRPPPTCSSPTRSRAGPAWPAVLDPPQHRRALAGLVLLVVFARHDFLPGYALITGPIARAGRSCRMRAGVAAIDVAWQANCSFVFWR